MLRVKRLLNDLVEYAYPDSPKLKAYQAFYVEYINKELKSKHGDYNPKDRRIRIYNLSRTEEQLVVTSIHELAHHISLIEHDSCKREPHGQEFYNVYRRLLFKALDMGLFNRYQFINATADASDSRKVAKILERYKPHPIEYKKEMELIQVFHAYKFRKELKERGYSYNPLIKAWELETENTAEESKYLDSLNAEYKTVSAKSISL